MENKTEFSNSEFLQKIAEAEEKLKNVKIASIGYLEQLANVERAVSERFKVITAEPIRSIKKRRIVKARTPKLHKCSECEFSTKYSTGFRII